MEFFYDAKLICFVDTDVDDLDQSRDDLEIKVIVSKNKFSGYKGIFNMMFYRSSSRVEELQGDAVEKKADDIFGASEPISDKLFGEQ